MGPWAASDLELSKCALQIIANQVHGHSPSRMWCESGMATAGPSTGSPVVPWAAAELESSMHCRLSPTRCTATALAGCGVKALRRLEVNKGRPRLPVIHLSYNCHTAGIWWEGAMASEVNKGRPLFTCQTPVIQRGCGVKALWRSEMNTGRLLLPATHMSYNCHKRFVTYCTLGTQMWHFHYTPGRHQSDTCYTLHSSFIGLLLICQTPVRHILYTTITCHTISTWIHLSYMQCTSVICIKLMYMMTYLYVCV